MANEKKLLNVNTYEEYTRLTPKSKDLWQRWNRVAPGGGGATLRAQRLGLHIPFFDRAEGAYLYDPDGNKYVDFRNTIAAPLGHNHPAVREALDRQVAESPTLNRIFPKAVELAELLCEVIPSFEQVVFTDSGARTTGYAVRLARAFTGRPKIAKFIGGFHGTDPELWYGLPSHWAGVTEAPGTKVTRAGYPLSLADNVVLLPFNHTEECMEIIERHKNELGSIIAEPIPEGAILPKREFLQALRDACTRYGIVLIFDEMITLMCAHGGVQKALGIIPDLTTTGKMVGGGLPMGALGGRKDLMDWAIVGGGGVPTGALGGLTDVLAKIDTPRGKGINIAATFAGHPLSVAAGLAQMRHMTPATYARLNSLADRITKRLTTFARRAEVPLQVTGMGRFRALHWNKEPVTDWHVHFRCDKEWLATTVDSLMLEGYVIYPDGRFLVSTPMTEEDVDGFAAAVEAIVTRQMATA